MEWNLYNISSEEYSNPQVGWSKLEVFLSKLESLQEI